MFLLFLAALAAPPPDVVVPDLAADSRKLGDPRKFFVFHQPGVSLEQARTDFAFCARYWRTGGGVMSPFFHPLDGGESSREQAPDGLGQ